LSKYYDQIRHLIEQYEKLQSLSVRLKNSVIDLPTITKKEKRLFWDTFRRARSYQARAKWVLETASKLFVKWKVEGKLEKPEKVEFT
jgi:hypothetical protein